MKKNTRKTSTWLFGYFRIYRTKRNRSSLTAVLHRVSDSAARREHAGPKCRRTCSDAVACPVLGDSSFSRPLRPYHPVLKQRCRELRAGRYGREGRGTCLGRGVVRGISIRCRSPSPGAHHPPRVPHERRPLNVAFVRAGLFERRMMRARVRGGNKVAT